MGKYSVPESIRAHKPKGTMVKVIGGKYYYVYEFSTVAGEDGRRRTKMGKCIGSIKEGRGFIPNSSLLRDDGITTLEFGEYAVVYANSAGTRELLNRHFNPEDADRIYAAAMIHFIEGYTYLKDIHSYYEMGYLSILYPRLKMGYDSLSALYENLGRRQERVPGLERELVSSCSGEIAVDGHVIAGCSECNDLSEKGYRFRKTGEPQMNLLMAYDVNTETPLFSRIYEGASPDKVSVRDLVCRTELRNMLFIVDRGFYSDENIRLFSSDGNGYIIPLSKNLTACKQAVSNLEMTGRFIYQKGRKSDVVEYRDETINGHRVITCRSLNEAAMEQAKYLKCIEAGKTSHTQERFDKLRDLMGVIVLQTSLEDRTPQEIFETYKKRWKIETYYNYFKNGAGFEAPCQQNYYKTQGLAFIMLISSLIHMEFSKAVKPVKGRSVHDCLLDARMVKAHKRHGVWSVSNCLKKQVELFDLLNTPLTVKCQADIPK